MKTIHEHVDGLIMPKMKHNFRVMFYSAGEALKVTPEELEQQPEHALSPVTKEIVEIFLPRNDYSGWKNDGENEIQFSYSDDILNRASKVLAQYGELQLAFDMSVEVLGHDGKPIETMIFANCSIQRIERMSSLSYYGAKTDRTQYSVDTKEIIGNLVDDTPGGEMMIKLLQSFFSNLRIVKEKSPKFGDSAAIHKMVSIKFDERKDFYL